MSTLASPTRSPRAGPSYFELSRARILRDGLSKPKVSCQQVPRAGMFGRLAVERYAELRMTALGRAPRSG
jgi:hypothetical protein